MGPNISKNVNIGAPQMGKSGNNTSILAVLFLVLCGVLVWFFILPKRAELAAKNKELELAASQQKSVADDLANLNKLVAELKKSPDDVKELDKALPLSGSTIELQLYLESLINSTSLTLGNLSLSGTGEAVLAGNTALLKDPYGSARKLQTISGSIYVIGTFPQLESFLKKIESSNRIMQVTDLEISGDKNSSLSLKLSFNSFYLAP